MSSNSRSGPRLPTPNEFVIEISRSEAGAFPTGWKIVTSPGSTRSRPLYRNASPYALFDSSFITSGRSSAGVSSTSVTHDSDTANPTRIATPAGRTIARHSPRQRHSTYSTAAGSTTKPSKNFTLNTTPISAHHATSSHGLRSSTATTSSHAPPPSSAITSASIVESRAVATDSGNTASSSAAISPTATPCERRPARNTSGAAAIPAIAIGSTIAQPSYPNSFVDSTCSHSPTGGLSTESVPAGSYAAYTKWCHDSPIDRIAEA